MHALELDDQAYGWAEGNLDGTGVDLRHGDMSAAFDDLAGAVDVLVSNPPYVSRAAWPSVSPEGRRFDPAVALRGGDDGLDALRVVEQRAADLLRPGGVCGTEHDDDHGPDGIGGGAPAVFTSTRRWTDVRDHADHTGGPRFTTARRPA